MISLLAISAGSTLAYLITRKRSRAAEFFASLAFFALAALLLGVA